MKASGNQQNQKRGGYTLFELLVVVSITVLLAGLSITYNHSGENLIKIYKDQSLLVGAILKAKALALQGYDIKGDGVDNFCGYGVFINSSPIGGTIIPATTTKFLIYRDAVPANPTAVTDPCLNSDKGFTGFGVSSRDKVIEAYTLSDQINFSNLTNNDILFLPPDPEVILRTNSFPPSATSTNMTVILQSLDGLVSATTTVNSFGQVTTK